jgi:hypothetical protein
MRAAHEGAMQHAADADIIDKAGTAGQQCRILDPCHPCPELPCAHDPIAPARLPRGAL